MRVDNVYHENKVTLLNRVTTTKYANTKNNNDEITLFVNRKIIFKQNV